MCSTLQDVEERSSFSPWSK